MDGTYLYALAGVLAASGLLFGGWLYAKSHGQKQSGHREKFESRGVFLDLSKDDGLPDDEVASFIGQSGVENLSESCWVLAHFGRFELCEKIIALEVKNRGKSDMTNNLSAWLDRVKKGDDWEKWFVPSWLKSESTVLDRADELLSSGKVAEARELLEEALQSSSGGDVGAIRSALRKVGKSLSPV